MMFVLTLGAGMLIFLCTAAFLLDDAARRLPNHNPAQPTTRAR